MKPELDLSSFEPARDENGDAILHAVNYPFRCVKITLTDKADHLLPAGLRSCWSFRFEVKGSCSSCARNLNPLLVRKVVVGYPEPRRPRMTLGEFESLSPALVLDYSLVKTILLPPEASIDKDGRLCWALTEVPPAVRVWSYVPLVIASTECLGAWPRSPDDPDELLIL